MRSGRTAMWLSLLGIVALIGAAGCGGAVPGGVGGLVDDIIDNGNDNGNGNDNDNSANDNDNDNGEPAGPTASLTVIANNTNGAGGLAFATNGDLYMVNQDGLFGPIDQDSANWPVDISTMQPIGATNLADADLFDVITTSHVLAITNSGEFWIGSRCCTTLAIVPPEGGDAEAFLDQLSGGVTTGIKPESMVIVPDGFDGPEIDPGNLLLGQDTTFSRLSAIDVEGDRAVVQVTNPIADDPDNPVNRDAHHLTFSTDGTLYSSDDIAALTAAGFQTIAEDGTPTDIAGTEGIAATTFVVLDNGDLLMRGTWQENATADTVSGVLLWSAADQTLSVALQLPFSEVSGDDEMIATPDRSTIYLSLPARNEIVRVDMAN